MTFIKSLIGVTALLAIPNETSAQSVQDIMNEALKIPQVRDAMRGRVQTPPRARDTRMMEVQTLLNARGFNSGAPDGIAGPGTRRAIAAFQQSINHAPTGTISEEELEILRSDAGTEKPTHKAKADQAEPVDILTIQSHLAVLGYDPGPVDGAWGKRSQSALDKFRREQNSSDAGRPTSEDMALLQSARSQDATSEDVTSSPDVTAKPTLFALPIVDRGAEFRVAWSKGTSESIVGLVPLWSDLSPQFDLAAATMPVSLTAPDKPGLYHIVLVEIQSREITSRRLLEVR